ncbi:MAG: hypothetical protein MT490_16650 [Sphingomonas sp.]|uniref:hypothetical protein n=1 Tax=Sphingomonas sp. TaxID=28214 RepID=UPI0022739DE2|nr:hypothetical protein [Sphingomonas sp.]MCX8477420.1 hypothetical protein [Sphingomonas sp.]
MIRATPLILAALSAAAPAVAQTQPVQALPTVESLQRDFDAFFAQPHDGITVTHARDDMKKTSLLVRTVGASKTVRRCETEFATPTEKINANARSERSWRVAWGSIAEVRREDAFRLELVSKKPDGVRTILEFPDARLAEDFAQAMDFLRLNCSG